MADTKISALPTATTPLAGTEVLPVVQSGATRQVSVADLTAGRPVSAASLQLTTTPLSTGNGGTGLSSYTAGDLTYYASGTSLTKLAIGASGRWLGSSGTAPQWNAPAALTETDDTNVTLTLGGNPNSALLNAVSMTLGWTGQLSIARGGTGNTTGAATAVTSNSTTGVMQITGPAAGTTRVMTIPNANFTVARTDSAQSFTGDQTLSTGNVIQGTAAKGYNFTANTPRAGMTSQLLNWYEEGTWTPVLNNFTTSGVITVTGTYTRNGRMVFVTVRISPSGGGTTAATSGIGSYIGNLPFAPSVASTGTWVNAGSVAASGDVWVNTDANMYLTQGWGTSAALFVFSAMYIV